jgi:predicted nucleic acid-binding protein
MAEPIGIKQGVDKTRQIKMRLTGLTPQMRSWYRALRSAGASRHDANLMVAGAAVYHNALLSLENALGEE